MGWVFNAMFFANKKGNHTSQLLFKREGKTKREKLYLQEKPEFILPVQLQVKPQSRLDFFSHNGSYCKNNKHLWQVLSASPSTPHSVFVKTNSSTNSHLLGSDPLVLNTSSNKKGVDVGVCPG